MAEDLRRLVQFQMGTVLGRARRPRAEAPRALDRKKDKEDGHQAIPAAPSRPGSSSGPRIFSDKINGIIEPEDFADGALLRRWRGMVFEAARKRTDGVRPAILNQFIDDEEQYREVAALFNASLQGIPRTTRNREKAFSETVQQGEEKQLWTVQSRNAKDIEELQQDHQGTGGAWQICGFRWIRARIPVPAQEGWKTYGRKDANI